MDALGSAIRVDTRGREVMRIMPRVNDDINEEWISDKTRFIWDGLRTQRLDRPYVRKDEKLVEASWAEAFSAIKSAIDFASHDKIGAVAGDFATVEEMYALKLLLKSLGSSAVDCRQDGSVSSSGTGRSSYIFNPTIAGIEDADALLIIGSNPRFEAAVMNARIRKRERQGNFPIGLIGDKLDLRYPYTYLGAGSDTLSQLLDGKNEFFEVLKKAEKPLILVGQAALVGQNGEAILKAISKLCDEVGALSDTWNGLGILQTAASRVGGLDIGFSSNLGAEDIVKSSEVLFLLGADEINLDQKKGFVIYIGSHGDNGAQNADVILPASAYTEKSGIYVNTEGRVQMTARAAFAPGEAKDDWAIIRALSEVLEHKLPFDSLADLRKNLFENYPHMANINAIKAGDYKELEKLGSHPVKLGKQAFSSLIKDFYLTNPIARASAVMAECSALAKARLTEAAE